MQRFNGLTYGTVALFGLTALSQMKLQWFESGDVIQRAVNTKKFIISVPQPARRGSILTSDGKPLAEDQAAWNLSISFDRVPHGRAFFASLSGACGIPESELEAMAESGGNRTWREPLSPFQADAVNKVKVRWRADGLSVVAGAHRSYEFGPEASGIAGRFKEGVATDGLENAYEKELAGVSGQKVGLVDRTGSFLPMRVSNESKTKTDGENITTTLDSGLQAEASSAIRAAVEANEADSGSAVIMDPATGSILAVANWPSYDPDPDPSKPKLARFSDLDSAYMSRMEPGSMMKILTLGRALDDKVVTPGWTSNCPGELAINSKAKVRCDDHHGNRAHGQVNLELAIEVSCNVSAARWGMAIGHDSMFRFLDSLGLLDKPGLHLKGEVKGQVNRHDYAQVLQLANLGFGQSITCTPVALASAFCAIGNGGFRPEPRLVDQIGPKKVPLAKARRVISESSANLVLHLMESVVHGPRGTGKDEAIDGYRLAGKTGTAQKKNGSGGYVSNFVGFVPARSPKAMILVMVDHPRKGKYYGAAVAGPVWRTLAKDVIRHFALPATEPILPKKSQVALDQ